MLVGVIHTSNLHWEIELLSRFICYIKDRIKNTSRSHIASLIFNPSELLPKRRRIRNDIFTRSYIVVRNKLSYFFRSTDHFNGVQTQHSNYYVVGEPININNPSRIFNR